MACARGHKFKYVHGYQPIDIKPSFESGSLVHELLRAHYQGIMDGKPYQQVVEESVVAGNTFDQKLTLHPRDSAFIIAKYREYANYYSGERIQPLAVEEWFNKELVTLEDLGKRIILFGKMDLIGLEVDHKRNVIFEHKSGERMFQPVLLDNQFQAYSWATGITRVVRNGFGLQEKYTPRERFKREFWDYTPSQLEEWREGAIHWVREYFKNASREYFPPNFASCQNRYGKCMFYEACVAPPEVRLKRLAAYFTRIQR